MSEFVPEFFAVGAFWCRAGFAESFAEVDVSDSWFGFWVLLSVSGAGW